jgi:hypothetical protein
VDMILEKDKNIDFNSKTVYGNTLLHSAARGGLTEFIKMLISKGLKADEKNIYGQTPFHFAAAGGHKEVIRLFLNKGCDINVKTNDGRTPIHFSRENGKKEVEDFLVKKGAYKDGTIYFKIITDLYRVRNVDGKYTKREKLDEINTEAFEIGPYIAPDESFIIFESDRPGGKGEIDLYICFRNPDDSWSEAINLGNTINTEDSERFPGISPDGKFFFYLGHTRDIYWVDAKIIRALKLINLK